MKIQRLTGLSWVLLLLGSLVLSLFSSSSVNSAAAAAPNFVTVQNNQLTLNNQPIVLKGFNYYPRDTDFAFFWEQWDGNAVQNDMAKMAAMNTNVVRVLIPYGGDFDWNNSNTGVVNPAHLDQLRQFVQIAGKFNLRVIITLFDFYGNYPAAGWDEEKSNFTYLDAIVNAFANDDRVLAWDIHNEPENYVPDFTTHPDKVLNWLSRMHDRIRADDPNHLITVGAGSYSDLWVTGSGGFNIISLSDFVSLHSYNALDFGNEVVHIREHTSKPILLEETGWPTGPTTAGNPGFTEAQQLTVYTDATKVAHDLNLAGLVAWDYSDHVPQGWVGYNDPVDYYGLMRTNGTLKPAAAPFLTGFTATPLPTAATQTKLPLTQMMNNTGLRAIYIPQTDKFISPPISDFWVAGGGAAVFGYPITEAFPVSTNGQDPVIGQYFQNAEILYHLNRKNDQKYHELKGFAQLLYIMEFAPLGQEVSAGSNFKPLANPTLPDSSNYKWFGYVGHDISQPFYNYWLQHYGQKYFGPPISEPFNEVDPATNRSRLVQYFGNAELVIGPDGGVTTASLGTQRAKQLNLLSDPAADPNASAFYNPAFQTTWQHTDTPVQNGSAGRTWLWGPQGFAAVIEPYAEAPGGYRLVEYFDKTRMEITNPSSDQSSKYYVTNGLLVKEMLAGQIQVGDSSFQDVAKANVPMAGDPVNNVNMPTYAAFSAVCTLDLTSNRAGNRTGQAVSDSIDQNGTVTAANPQLAKLTSYATYNSVTGHNIPAVFWNFMTNTRGPVVVNNQTTTGDPVDWTFSIGLPLSEAYWTKAIVGGVQKDVLVQAFERRVLTYTPSNDSAFQVEMGNVGRAYYQWRYGTAQGS